MDIIHQFTPIKRCLDCKHWFPSTLFTHNGKNKLRPYCRPCNNIRAKSTHTRKVEQPACNEGEKRCVLCEKVFPATTAYFHKAGKGLHPRCKKCRGNSTHFGKERTRSNEDEKWCPHCERMLPRTREYFQLNKNTLDNLQSWCIECRNKTYEQSKDDRNQRQRAKRKDNPEKFREYERLRYASNPQAVSEKNKRSYIRNWHKSRHTRNLYRQAHLEKHNTYMRNREALKKAIPGTLTDQQIQYKLRKQRFRCYYAACGHAKFERRKGRYIYHLEHTIPVSRTEHKPRNDASYVVLACPHCNLTKSNKLPHEWVEGGTLF